MSEMDPREAEDWTDTGGEDPAGEDWAADEQVTETSEADEADVAEQSIDVELDDEDYR